MTYSYNNGDNKIGTTLPRAPYRVRGYLNLTEENSGFGCYTRVCIAKVERFGE